MDRHITNLSFRRIGIGVRTSGVVALVDDFPAWGSIKEGQDRRGLSDGLRLSPERRFVRAGTSQEKAQLDRLTIHSATNRVNNNSVVGSTPQYLLSYCITRTFFISLLFMVRCRALIPSKHRFESESARHFTAAEDYFSVFCLTNLRLIHRVPTNRA